MYGSRRHDALVMVQSVMTEMEANEVQSEAEKAQREKLRNAEQRRKVYMDGRGGTKAMTKKSDQAFMRKTMTMIRPT